MTQTIPITPPIMQIGTLYTLGYADPHAKANLEQWMCHDATILLVDIRYSPRSRFYREWNRAALTARYGRRYIWEQRLGNVNYQHREAGIVLAPGYQDAIREATDLLQRGTNLILLCACKDQRVCHRSLVAKLIHDTVSVTGAAR